MAGGVAICTNNYIFRKEEMKCLILNIKTIYAYIILYNKLFKNILGFKKSLLYKAWR